jgi:hypothetical protein
MIDNRTERNYPLPHPENIAYQDVQRIRDAFVAVDTDITAVEVFCVQLRGEFDRGKFEEFLGLWK